MLTNKTQITKQITKFSAILLLMFLLISASQVLAQGQNLIQNGSFERGFETGTGQAENWTYFHSGGSSVGFGGDTWRPAVIEGDRSLIIRLSNASTSDTYAGVHQTVAVTPGQTYQLSFKGFVRSGEGDTASSSYGYIMQYAVDLNGNKDWRQVGSWTELPWGEEPLYVPAQDNAFTIYSEKTSFTATSDTVTIFFRGWKKWANGHEGNYNLDAVRLVALSNGETASSTMSTSADQSTSTADDSQATMGIASHEPSTEIVEPLPQTGQETIETTHLNSLVLAISLAVILLLISGAIINRKKLTN